MKAAYPPDAKEQIVNFNQDIADISQTQIVQTAIHQKDKVYDVNIINNGERFVLDREKPLALYLFTTSKATEKRVLTKLSSGGACINDTIIQIMCKDLCFGGVGSSGMGLYHGEHGFKTFSHTKGVYKKYAVADMSFRYHPYTDAKCKVTRFLMK